MKLALLALLLLLTTMVTGKGHNKNENLFDKEFRKKMTACEKNDCSFLPTNFNDNCVNQCISKKCYEQAFFGTGLEPGEIDQKRSKAFKDCIMLEWKKCENPQKCPL